MTNTYPQRGFTLPPDARELILARHGASQAAVPDQPFALLDGHADPPLAREGVEQAIRLAERLAPEAPAALFVTPLQRTSQTAAPLAESTGLEPLVIPELREVLLGDWEGGEFRIRVANGDPLVARLFNEERWDVIPGAEPRDAFAARVGDGLRHALDRVPDGRTGVAVLHGGVIAEICHQVTGSRPFAFIQVDNTSITRLVRFANGRWLLRGFNDTAHLAVRPTGGEPATRS
ncbi:MAG TPA: histidine phosphatase family protein [Thermoleophilaceae bacterium]|nr:histidine phosphatase family protein [Thermoleophilaceae bacterium]